jgi:UDP-N-acetylmuramate--alanine ligase
VVDDYGHHPTEIRSTLEALKECWPGRRKVIAFQPHRYSRTLALFDDFTRAFYQSDVLVVLPIYPAGEKKIEGVSAMALCERIRSRGHKNVIYLENVLTAPTHLRSILRPGDVLLTLGAGDVWKVGEGVLKQMLDAI